jgi:hypothetical protein
MSFDPIDAGIDLIRPNFEVRQLCLPIDRKVAVHSVVPEQMRMRPTRGWYPISGT